MNLTLLDLEARQRELSTEIYSLRFRVHQNEATTAEKKRLRTLEWEFAAANARLKQWRERLRKVKT